MVNQVADDVQLNWIDANIVMIRFTPDFLKQEVPISFREFAIIGPSDFPISPPLIALTEDAIDRLESPLDL